MRSRMHVVVAAVALPLSLVAAPAHAGPAVSKHTPPMTEPQQGTLERLKVRTNKIRLTDKRVLRYDKNDLILAQHLYDTEDAEGPDFFCDLFDSGGEELAAAFAASGLEVSVDYLDLPRRKDVSSFLFSIDTCDGTVDAADLTPRPRHR